MKTTLTGAWFKFFWAVHKPFHRKAWEPRFNKTIGFKWWGEMYHFYLFGHVFGGHVATRYFTDMKGVAISARNALNG